MKRRALLAALAPLTAGCFGATRAETDQPPATETPGQQSTETPDTQSTATPDTTGSTDREEAVGKIDTAQDRLREAVYIYAGGVSSELLDVSAATEEFDDRSVLLKLSDVQTAINEAERAAVTAEQKETVESLREMHRFLTRATDLQAWLIQGHEAVADTYDAIDDGDDGDTVKAELDAVEQAVDKAGDPLEAVTAVESGAADSTDAISTTEFERKVTQFENEMDVLDQLHGSLSTIQAEREELDAARAKADNGDYYSAEQAAERAADSLDETVETLETLDEDPPEHAGAFNYQIEDVLALARDYAAEADDLQNRYG
jgi:prefoldin subunit 5